MRSLKLVLILPLLAACQREAVPQETGGGLDLEAAAAPTPVTYGCGRGQELSVTYDQGGLAHLVLDGIEMRLTQRATARGASYSDGKTSWDLVNARDLEIGTLTGEDGNIIQCSRRAPTAAPAPTLTACRADQLEAKAGEIDAGMGHRHMPVTVTLKGATGCILPQWPELALMPEEATRNLKVERTTDTYFAKSDAPSRVSLERGQSAQFYLGWGVVPHEAEGETICAEVSGWRLKAPGGGQLAEIPAEIQACGRRVTVSPFLLQARNGDAAAKPS